MRSRTHDQANEITEVDGDSEPLAQDAAGNLTEYPRYAGLERAGAYVAEYDAWNRLVEVQKDPDSPTTVATYAYDGLNRRIVKKVQNAGDLNMTYHCYYSGQRMIETRNGSDLVLKQYTWAPQAGGVGGGNGGGYLDELVQIAVNDDPTDITEGDGTQSLCETKYWAMHGLNYNVLGLVDDAGNLVERYEYTPYGERQVYTAGYADPKCYTPAAMSKRIHAPGGVAQPYGLNPFGHQGLMHDEETGLVYNRERMRKPRLGRFMQRDQLGYVDGVNLYRPAATGVSAIFAESD